MSRLFALVALAIVALAASVAAQNCVVTVQDYGTDSTCTSLNTSTAVTQGIGACPSTINYQYLQVQCLAGFNTDSNWVVDVWSPAQGGCTGGYAGRASGANFAACATYGTGASVSTVSYFRVNCSCVDVIPAVSSSSANPVSSSSAGSTGLSSSVAPIDYGCSHTVTQYSAAGCGTAIGTINPLSRVCTPFAIVGGTQYYISLACSTPGQVTSNWAAAVYQSSVCAGTVATALVSQASNPTACETGAAVGTQYFISVNCSCALGGRRYSSTGIISSTGLTGVSGQTSSVTSGATSVSGATSTTSGNTGSGSSTTGSSSSAPASRSGVVAIVAAVAAGVVALLA